MRKNATEVLWSYDPEKHEFTIDGSVSFANDLDRDDPDLIDVVRALGAKAGENCDLVVQEVTVSVIIESFDGKEKVSASYCTVKRSASQ